MDALKRSKKISRLKSMGFSHCFVVLHKTTSSGLSDTIIENLGHRTGQSRPYTTVLFTLQLRTGVYRVETNCAGEIPNSTNIEYTGRPLRQHSFCHMDNDLQEAVWNEFCRLPFSRNFEIECGIIKTERQQNQLTALESRLDKQTTNHNDCVFKQQRDLYEYQEDTTARLTAQASVSEQLQNQINTVSAAMKCINSAVQTLREEQGSAQETAHTELESRGEWTTLVMSELAQRKTEVEALGKQLERYRKDARWMGYACVYLASLIVVHVSYIIACR